MIPRKCPRKTHFNTQCPSLIGTGLRYLSKVSGDKSPLSPYVPLGLLSDSEMLALQEQSKKIYFCKYARKEVKERKVKERNHFSPRKQIARISMTTKFMGKRCSYMRRQFLQLSCTNVNLIMKISIHGSEIHSK